MKKKQLKVKDDLGDRVDVYISNYLENISRSQIKKLIKEEKITVNKEKVKPRYIVKNGDIIEVEINQEKEQEIIPKAENIPIKIIYQDEDLAVIDKPQGMVVYPAKDNVTGTLVNALLYHFNSLSTMGGQIRPGIVHRIDKDTSGLLVIAKNDFAHKDLANQFKEYTAIRKYYALVDGVIEENTATIDAPIGRHPINRTKMTVTEENSRQAITYFKVIKRFQKNTLIEAQLETGRTHQIRVHMSYINRPVVGDLTYGYKQQNFKLQGQLLFSKIVGFVHPRNSEYMEFESQLPDYFTDVLNTLET